MEEDEFEDAATPDDLTDHFKAHPEVAVRMN